MIDGVGNDMIMVGIIYVNVIFNGKCWIFFFGIEILFVVGDVVNKCKIRYDGIVKV